MIAAGEHALGQPGEDNGQECRVGGPGEVQRYGRQDADGHGRRQHREDAADAEALEQPRGEQGLGKQAQAVDGGTEQAQPDDDPFGAVAWYFTPRRNR